MQGMNPESLFGDRQTDNTQLQVAIYSAYT
jgi:hypothetical protein